MESDKLKSLAKAVLENESQAIAKLASQIDANFILACEILLSCEGRIVVMGMGKSGHIGNKIAATLASTGSPSFFVHPGEASHGDMGMITAKDVVLAFSNSGETDEILTLLPLIKRLGVPLVAVTGNPTSTLAGTANVHIDVSVEKEACPLGLAPTTSTTVALAMGDALAISLLESRGFTADDFALSHPGGRLGRRLLLRVADIMHTGDKIPVINDDVDLARALVEMTDKSLGMTLVVNDTRHLVGIFTDGDLRRVLGGGAINIHEVKVKDVMIKTFKHADPQMLAEEALKLMQQYKINSMPVVDAGDALVGAVNFQDLLRAGVV